MLWNNCGKTLNCTSATDPTVIITPDPDIIGNGVLAGFMATAFITFLAVVFGYIFNSLPEDYYTEFDDRLIAFILWRNYQPRQKRATNRNGKTVENGHNFHVNEETTSHNDGNAIRGNTNASRHEEVTGSNETDVQNAEGQANNGHVSSHRVSHDGTGKSKETQEKEAIAKEKFDDMKIEALQRLILALSDQQLITGLAILAAGIIKSCTISWWEFQVVVSLAWFSSTTHLSTLVILWDYLQQHRVLMYWRVGGMLCMLVVLFFCVLSEVALPPDYQITAPMECVFMHMSSGLKYDPGFQVPVILVFLCLAYSNQVMKLLSSDRGTSVIKRCETFIAHEYIFVATRFFHRRISRDEWQKTYLPMVKERSLNAGKIRREKVRAQLEIASPQKRRRLLFIARLIAYLTLLNEASETYLESFMWQIVWLTFGLTYGIAQVVQVRWINLPLLDGSTNHMDFGQIVPLLLLTLPALAAGEAYCEWKDSIKKKKAEEEKGKKEEEAKESADNCGVQQGSGNNIVGQSPSTAPRTHSGGEESLQRSTNTEENNSRDSARQSASNSPAVAGELAVEPAIPAKSEEQSASDSPSVAGGLAVEPAIPAKSEDTKVYTVKAALDEICTTSGPGEASPPQVESVWPWYVSEQSVWEVGQGKIFFSILWFLLLSSTVGLVFFAVSLQGFFIIGVGPSFFLPFVCGILVYYEGAMIARAIVDGFLAIRKKKPNNTAEPSVLRSESEHIGAEVAA